MNRFWQSASLRKIPQLCTKVKTCSPKVLTLLVPACAITKTAHCYLIPRASAINTVTRPLIAFYEEEEDTEVQSEPPFIIKKIIVVASSVFYIAKLCLRCIKIILLFLPPLLLLPFTILHEKIRHQWWQLFLLSIQFGGPVFTKLGQWVSTRRDIFSVEVCNYMSQLQHSTRPHSWRFTVQAMEKSFGENWNDTFINFEPEPYGSGCIAQVYKSYIKKEAVIKSQRPLQKKRIIERIKEIFTGHSYSASYKSRKLTTVSDSEGLMPVAVKVLHPGIQNLLEQDLAIIRAIAKGIEKIFPNLKWLSLSECIEEFKNYMLSQIDMVQEAAMLDKFNFNFKGDSTVSFPRPIRPYVASGVLVETWEEGEPISCFLSNDYPQELKNKIAELGMDMLLKMIFVHNFVHGDMHPGNILVQNVDAFVCRCNKPVYSQHNDFEVVDFCDVVICDCTSQNKGLPKLVILDCGLVSLLPHEDFKKLYNVFRAVVMDKGEEVGELFLQHSVNQCEDPEAFKNGMKDLINYAKQDSLSLGKVDVGKLLHSVFILLTTSHVKLESNFLSVILAVMVLEGLGRSLNPHLDLMNKARPYLLSPLPHF